MRQIALLGSFHSLGNAIESTFCYFYSEFPAFIFVLLETRDIRGATRSGLLISAGMLYLAPRLQVKTMKQSLWCVSKPEKTLLRPNSKFSLRKIGYENI